MEVTDLRRGLRGRSRDWLNIVKTSPRPAGQDTRSWFKREAQGRAPASAAGICSEKERQAAGLHYRPARVRPDNTEMIRNKYSLNTLDDLYAAIGFGGISVNQVMTRLVEDYKRYQQKLNPAPPITAQDLVTQQPASKPQSQQSSSNGVFVKGEPGLLVRFAKCQFSPAGRRDYRLHHARARRIGASRGLPERARHQWPTSRSGWLTWRGRATRRAISRPRYRSSLTTMRVCWPICRCRFPRSRCRYSQVSAHARRQVQHVGGQRDHLAIRPYHRDKEHASAGQGYPPAKEALGRYRGLPREHMILCTSF